jgi:hypothetical protein
LQTSLFLLKPLLKHTQWPSDCQQASSIFFVSSTSWKTQHHTFAVTSCGKKEQKVHSLSLRDALLLLFFCKGAVQQYVPDVMGQYGLLIELFS